MSRAGFEFLPPPFVIRRGRLGVTYRSRWRTLLLAVALIAAVLAVGVFADLMVVAATLSALIAIYWTSSTVRLIRGIPIPFAKGGGGSAPPGAGTREPRRPRPLSPAGAAAIPLPEADETPIR